jgi:hypothetical protein
MRRARLLALLLVLLAAAATLGCGLVPHALFWPARLALLFLLPFAASVAASLLLPREPQREGRSARVLGTARFHLLIAAAILLDLGAIGAGYALGWTTFTYGEQALEAHKLLAVPLALPFTIAAATLGTEWALHARLWESLAHGGRRREAAALAVGCGVALAVPALAPGFVAVEPAFLVAGLALALLREVTALELFKSGGLLVAGAWRGSLVALEAFGLGDWNSFYFPMANYVTSEPLFYPLRVAGGAAALLLVLVAARRWRESPG